MGDVREKIEYKKCHIKCAKSFPLNHLKQDKITSDLHYYKNRDNHVIVIYDLNDRMARNVATMFTEKGYENIFLMTGGLERFVHSTPSLCVGELPRNEGKENNKKKVRVEKIKIEVADLQDPNIQQKLDNQVVADHPVLHVAIVATAIIQMILHHNLRKKM